MAHQISSSADPSVVFASTYTRKDIMTTAATYLVSLVVFINCLSHAGASCTEEQVSKCRQAAESDTLGSLEGGGKCSAQRYVHYTHACTVSDYRPHIDFCCCAASVKVLCCRYQQSWDRFRCSEAEDTIHTLCNKRNEKGESVCAPKRPPLYILLPCVLGPLAILGCCIYCCVRHCRYCHNDDDEEIKWGCTCWSPEKKKNDPSHAYQFQNSHSESEPLNLPASLLSDGKRPLDHLDSARMMPTAPQLLDDSADEAFASGHCHRHHPHHRVHGHYGPSSLSGKQQPHSHHSDRHPSASYSDPHRLSTSGGGYVRQPSVVSAPGGMYSRAESGGVGVPPPCTGGCGYIRQDSAPCGPMAPSYSAAPPHHHHTMMPLPTSGMPSTAIPPPPSAVQPPTEDSADNATATPPADSTPPAEGVAGAEGGCPQPPQPAGYGAVPAHVNVHGPRGAAGAPCPSCSTTVCAPPTYDESLQHQVLHQ